MLTLQRASAGSGKTYTLTKKFLTLLISKPIQGSSGRELRQPGELHDSLSHILAVTFTNKATDEMKQRITGALNDLAYNINPSDLKNTKYLLDFMAEFDATYQEISDLCKIALRELLISFSDFNVLTIDAFFQAILRTFAYEAELPDGYELIINNDYISRQVVFEMLDGLSSGKIETSTKFWARMLIEEAARRGSRHWNVFNRKESNIKYDSTDLLASMYNMASDLDKEANKEARAAIMEYFSADNDLLKAYKDSTDYFENRITDLFAKVNVAAREVLEEAERLSTRDISEYITHKNVFANQIRKMASPDADPLVKISYSGQKNGWTEENLLNGDAKNDKRLIEELVPGCGALLAALDNLYDCYKEWIAALEDIDYQLWECLKSGFPRIGLMHDFQKRAERFLVESGTMKLSDTNTILHRIINDDDVPFVYERYGSIFHHFLIDEFQDTSELQWKNFRPLLRESESHGFENLIIGDAKQSIYRFRSADPKLITDKVPAEFPELESRGDAEEENTNRRSARHIVEFNNSFFHHLSQSLNSDKLAALYGNTVQKPGKASEEGYVEVAFYPQPKAAPGESEKSGELAPALLEAIGARIDELLERGYQQREIAVLVNAKDTARQIITYLNDYNVEKRKGKPQLAFVSEDSLVLSSSRAVQQVVHCLRMIQNGVDGTFEDAAVQDNNEYSRVNWLDVAAHFRYYSLHNSDKSFQDQIEDFLAGEFSGESMAELLANMQAVTLPSLVEALTECFVDEQRREREALFLSAFQDEVLSYSDVYPADIASFLRWWDTTGKNISVVSPDGTDAITIMTIHKSKGLEFECVLLPDMDFSLKLRSEWIWVNIPSDYPVAELIPKMMPVEFKETQNAAGFWPNTPYKDLYQETIYFNLADKVNKAYVAMTRPVSELYIYLPEEKKNDKVGEEENKSKEKKSKEKKKSTPETKTEVALDNIGNALREIFGNYDKYSENSDPQLDDKFIDTSKLEVDESVYRYGEPLQNVTDSLRKRREERRSSHKEVMIEDYFVNSDRDILQYSEEGLKPRFDAADDDRADPRSEGSLLHAVLEQVKIASDLDSAFEKLRVRGLITRSDIRKYKPMLKEALDSVEDRKWFDGSKRVINERALLKKGEKMLRPDRVMIDSEGSMTVIDYKFGSYEKRKIHHRQVRNYMDKLREYSAASNIDGYIWYVKEGKVEKVEG